MESQPTVVVVGGQSAPPPEPSSGPTPSPSTPDAERREMLELGAVLEAHRNLAAQSAATQARLEAMEVRDQERAAQVDRLISALAEDEAEEDLEVALVTPEPEPPSTPEPEPETAQKECPRWLAAILGEPRKA